MPAYFHIPTEHDTQKQQSEDQSGSGTTGELHFHGFAHDPTNGFATIAMTGNMPSTKPSFPEWDDQIVQWPYLDYSALQEHDFNHLNTTFFIQDNAVPIAPPVVRTSPRVLDEGDCQPLMPASTEQVSSSIHKKALTKPASRRTSSNKHLVDNVPGTFVFSITNSDSLGQTWDESDDNDASGTSTSDGSVRTRRSSSHDSLWISKCSESPIEFSPPAARKRTAPNSSQAVFRAFGVKRSKFNESSRSLTALTRKLGACDACRKKKIRCEQAEEPFVPCGQCKRTPSHLLYAPCCRVEIIDVKLFRLGTTLEQLAVLQHWMRSKEPGRGRLLLKDGSTAFEAPRRVRITHDVCTTTFEATISRYQPGPDDKTGYSWTDANGNKNTYELPPYYISDLAEAGQNLRRYIKKARAEFPRALLTNSNPIIQKIFKEAENYWVTSKSKLVAAALVFWSATRMTERFWLITGDDMLGLPPMTQSIGPCRFNPYIKAVPVTPIMDTQLDELAIKHVLVPLKNNLLHLLREKILAKKKENWYEIFLATFIILHNSEVVLGQVMDYSRRYGISFAPKGNDEASLSHAYYHACKTVLAYYHFASGGAAPLTLEGLSHARKLSIMSPDQIEFLQDMKAELSKQDEKISGLTQKPMYENELYWCHQLLFSDWKADMPHAGPFLACTEKDFLLS